MLKDSLTKTTAQAGQSQGFMLGAVEATVLKFQNLKGPHAIFALRLNHDYTISVDGWGVSGKGKMNNDPDVKLEPVSSSMQPALKFESVYLGINFLKDVKGLQAKLEKAKMVRFEPFVEGNFLKFKIFAVLSGATPLVALATTNPCPPKQLSTDD